ncbi:MAG: hypothetical protein U1E10_11380 [Bdellovibrionales bacterium]|nr:hypothetical protein [Bdellovibrionales bacterium]
MKHSFQLTFILMFSVFSGFAQIALAQTLKPFKDELYSLKNRKVLEARDGGSYKRYVFGDQDVNGRDKVAGKVAKDIRVDLSVLKSQRIVNVPSDGGFQVEAYEVGEPKNASFAVVFVHGGGGNKDIGANDVSFGGNFNRLKNLVSTNGGVYYSPTVGTNEDARTLIRHIRTQSPDAKVILVCGSAGAYACWDSARSPQTSPSLAGLIFLGGTDTLPGIENSTIAESRLPIIFSHGSKDPIVPPTEYEEHYKALKKMDPKYPVQMQIFEGGKHGTPIRMIDYKDSLQWLLAENAKRPTNPAASGTTKKVEVNK